jgi:hypothetical protein
MRSTIPNITKSKHALKTDKNTKLAMENTLDGKKIYNNCLSRILKHIIVAYSKNHYSHPTRGCQHKNSPPQLIK